MSEGASKANMKQVGDRIDLGFSVKAVVNGERWEGPFEELVKGPTVISVYMKNNTKSCDLQAAELGRIAAEFSERGVNVIGLSKDTVGSHDKYRCKHGFEFTLVSDSEHQFAKATESLIEKKMYGKVFFGPSRSAYLIDEGGTLLGVVESVDSKRHAEQLRKMLEAAE